MGNPSGVRRDFKELEKRRIRAIGLWQRGETQAAVARRVSVAPQTVARWVCQFRRQGTAGLKMAELAGRKPGLNQKELERLKLLLLAGPQRIGYDTPRWTCPRVADLIERKFGVRYHPGHIWKLLSALGWTPQRPICHALDDNQAKTLRWRGNGSPDCGLTGLQ
jgi:transposase